MILVTGLSPRLACDSTYREFLQLFARQLDTTLATVRAVEHEKQRLAQLAELNRQKIAFFSNVSHEFRTPLTLMLSPLEDAAALPRPVLEGEQLAMVHHNAQRLLKHVNALLDFSRIEAGKFQAAYVPTDLATFTADVASAFRSLIERAGLALIVECPVLPDLVWVDHAMWEKLVSNLLSNAFKFTLEGKIVVRLRWRSDHVELAVEDTGTGIPEGALPRLFERFNRVEGAKGRSYEGSGIGLALVQEIARAHGGTIAVASKVGRGSIFMVSIPTGCSHLPDEQVLSARAFALTPTSDAFVLEASAWTNTSSSSLARMETRSVPPVNSDEASTRQGRVLVADDNADMREYVRRLLYGRFTVEAVPDGDAAFAAAQADPPDLILADVMMPGLDGFALLRTLKANEKTANVPIVLLSARAGDEAKIEGLSAGASDYLVKPFSSRELIARIEGAIHIAKARARLVEVLEAMGDAFFVVDRDWRFVLVNASFERVAASPRSETIGRIIWDKFPAAATRDSKYWVELGRCMEARPGAIPGVLRATGPVDGSPWLPNG
jgi:CheY-like chemotaxis protein/nitrogen-specific signal transduction histidine kinase